MLTTLRIKNLALVSDLTLELQPGCNVITGETGAGKSIILGALNLVLGERADRTLIRSGEESCSVEAVFDVKKLRAPLKTFWRKTDLNRVKNISLSSNARLPVPARTASSSTAHPPRSPPSPPSVNGWWTCTARTITSRSCIPRQLARFSMRLAVWQMNAPRLANSSAAAPLWKTKSPHSSWMNKLTRSNLISFAFKFRKFPLRACSRTRRNPSRQEFNRASNAAKLLQLSQAALDALSENENSLLTQSGVIGRVLAELQRVDAGAENLADLHAPAGETLRELQTELSRYADKVDVDPARLAEVEERLNLIHTLKRKYGATLAEVIAFGNDAQTEIGGARKP